MDRIIKWLDKDNHSDEEDETDITLIRPFLYPVPAIREPVYIKNITINAKVRVYDIKGHLILETDAKDAQGRIRIDPITYGLASGLYLVYVTDTGKKPEKLKLLYIK